MLHAALLPCQLAAAAMIHSHQQRAKREWVQRPSHALGLGPCCTCVPFRRMPLHGSFTKTVGTSSEPTYC